MINVLDHGFVRMVSVMGDDAAICEAARVSYGGPSNKTPEEDRKLIRYLMCHKHTSPFEMCLRGDTRISSMPCKGAARKSWTIKEIADAFSKAIPPTWVKQIKIRTVNSDGIIEATHIKHAKLTGTKRVYRLRTKGPLSRTIYGTDNHPFLTPIGYKCLGDLQPGNIVMLNGRPELSTAQLATLWNTGYKIQDIADTLGCGRVTAYRRLRAAGIDTSKRRGFQRKDATDLCDPRARSRKFLKVECEICGEPAKDVHHIDENPNNDSPENLLSVCLPCHNAFHNDPFQLRVYGGVVESIVEVGRDEVYDLEVESENHNFVAEGFVVHNCEFKFHCKMPIFVARQWIRHRTANVNEISGRYSQLPAEYYIPELEQIRKQSKTNKQGRDEEYDLGNAGQFRVDTQLQGEGSFNTYQAYLDAGLARELARINLPLSTYTEWYWKIDLHNLFHFLKLRMDSHAQYEIRVYAEAIYELTKRVAPVACEAFEDYNLKAVTFSAQEMNILKAYISADIMDDDQILSSRELNEFKEKLGL